VHHLGAPATECLYLLVGPPVGGYAYAPARQRWFGRSSGHV